MHAWCVSTGQVPKEYWKNILEKKKKQIRRKVNITEEIVSCEVVACPAQRGPAFPEVSGEENRANSRKSVCGINNFN